MGFININNLQLYCAGNLWEPNTSLILAIHGAGGSRLVWEPLQQHLPQIWAVDLPNHGRSSAHSITTLNDYTTIIDQLLRQLPHTAVYIMGHSMGGAITQLIAQNPPENVKGIILVATSPDFQVNPQLLTGLQTDFLTTAQQLNRYSWSRKANPALVEQAERWFQEAGPQTVYDDFKLCADFDLREQLSKIMLPTLVIEAEFDRMVKKGDGRFLAQNIPHTTLHTIPKVGHYPQNEAPEAVSQIIKEWLSSQQNREIHIAE